MTVGAAHTAADHRRDGDASRGPGRARGAESPGVAAGSLALSAGVSGLRVQRACACGGTCADCQAEEEQLAVQRAPADEAPASPPPVATAPVIVDDGTPAAGGQLTREQFVATMRGELLPMCDAELAAAGRTAADCPYLVYWLAFAATRTAPQLERAVRRFTRSAATTATDLIDAVVSRVRAAIRFWVATGDVAVPVGLGPVSMDSGTGGVAGDLLQRVFGDGDEAAPAAPAVQPKGAPGAARGAGAHDPAGVQRQLGAGHALDSGVRGRMERGFGRSFAGVRVHTDQTAHRLAGDLSARAFTVGRDIAFRSGEFRPGSVVGDLLIAHELAHTVQQGDARVAAARYEHQDRALEDEADVAAAGVVGTAAGIAGLPGGGTARSRTGLRLQGCQEVKKRCPTGYSWRVERTAGAGSFGCACFWKCLPGEPPGRPSNVSEVRCPPDMNCSTGVRYEVLGDDYTKTGYGAALTPLGEQAYCGCFPLNFEGQKVSEAPLTKNDFELMDVLGPIGDMAAARKGGTPVVDPTTGTVIPGKKGGVTPDVAGATPSPVPKGGFTTKPMLGSYKGEHLPGNPIWQGTQVKYLTDAERTAYRLEVRGGKIYDASGQLFDTTGAASAHSGSGSAIFVMDSRGQFFASKTQTVGEFHHSSLAAGQPVAAAGELRVQNGVLVGITDKSGHYRPTPEMLDQAVTMFRSGGVDMTGVSVSKFGKPNP